MKAIFEDFAVGVPLHVTEQKIFHKYVKGFWMSEPEESGPEDHTCPRHDASARE